MQEVGLAPYQDDLFFLAIVFVGVSVGMVALVILGMLFVKFCRELCLRRIEYKRFFQETGVFEGEEIELVEEFTNHSFVPMFLVDVQTHISSKIKMQCCERDDGITQEFISRFFIMPYTKIRRVHKAVCKKRGFYQLESAKITFAGVEVYVDSKAALYVYPKEVSFFEEKKINSILQYSAVSKRPLMEDKFSFAGVREYMRGDAMNALNYKQTAKRGQWMVNDRDYMLGRQILIYINVQPNEKKYFLPEQFQELVEKELSYATYMLAECVRNGYTYSLRTNSKMVYGGTAGRQPFVSGEENYREFLCLMSEMTSLYAVSMVSVIKNDILDGLNGTEIFLFTPYFDESLEIMTEQLEEHGNVVNVIDVSEEFDVSG